MRIAVCYGCGVLDEVDALPRPPDKSYNIAEYCFTMVTFESRACYNNPSLPSYTHPSTVSHEQRH